jgi:uncharacterized membrane protein HdeD (DUF308 family)
MLLLQGMVLMILGIVALCLPLAATLAADVFVGSLLLIGGVAGLFAIFATKRVGAFAWGFLTAAVSAVAGGVLLWQPVEGAVSLTMLLIAFFVVQGVFEIAASAVYRPEIGRSWGWMLASGIADLVLAALIVAGWPMSAAWALGLLLGVSLFTSGWAIAMIALAARGAVRSGRGYGRAAGI